MRPLSIAVILFAFGTPALGVANPPIPDRPGIDHWIAALGSSDAGQRETALAALQAVAAGPVEETATREASFALAEHGAGSERETARALETATSLYPDDERTPRLLRSLVRLQLAAGDAFGAHTSFRRLVGSESPELDAGLLARGAANAAAAGDAVTGLAWAERIDAEQLDEEGRLWLHLARLEGGYALNRLETAVDAARELERLAPERIRLERRALLAAAGTYARLGLLTEATEHYQVFVNVHSMAPERPGAMLELARLYSRMGETPRAERTLDWLIETNPQSDAAHQARLLRLELEGTAAGPSSIPGYLDAMERATSLRQAQQACRRFAERFVAAGLPAELWATLANVARETDDGLAPLAARQCLNDAIEPVVKLLATRDDAVAVAAIAADAESLGVSVPEAAKDPIATSRKRLGLPAFAPGPLDTALAEAHRSIRRGRADEALDGLEAALAVAIAPRPAAAAEASRLAADALWRSGRTEEALVRVRRVLESESPPEIVRAARVLLADILFAEGHREEACPEYRRANEAGTSPWVRSQLERCDGAGGDPAGPSRGDA